MKTHFTYYSPFMTASMAAALAFLEPQARGEDAQPARPNIQAAAVEKSQAEAQKRFETAEKEYQKARALQARAADQRAEEALRAASGSKQEYDLVIADGMLIKKGAKEGKVEATLANVVDALRDRYSDANIVLSPVLAKLTISDLKLRSGRLADELTAIQIASGEKVTWVGAGWNGSARNVGIDPATGLPVAAATQDPNAGLFILREAVPPPEQQRLVEAFNLSGYLEWLKAQMDPNEAQDSRQKQIAGSLRRIEEIVAETIATLKQGAVGNVETPHFQFHDGADLLIVTGTPAAVEVARKVVTALPGRSRPPTSFGGGGGRGGAAPGGEAEAFRRRYGLPEGGGAVPVPAPPPVRQPPK